MGIITLIIFGFIVGLIAKLLMPGKDPGGFIITILLGIAGSLLGGVIGRALGMYGPGQRGGFFMSIACAILLLAIYHVATRRRHQTPAA
ncbi:MAG: GlsB/YeaQ/YmgE family stress response membrane protein [Deltaproteobacteria bacterium]|nr:GlsB/YeaQ/YmgE family stress response membrane protein [Deltaproteobacteria bacterium]